MSPTNYLVEMRLANGNIFQTKIACCTGGSMDPNNLMLKVACEREVKRTFKKRISIFEKRILKKINKLEV
jgi:hypothetical protein